MTPQQHLEILSASASAARFAGLQTRQGAINNILAEEAIAKALARLVEAEVEIVELKKKKPKSKT